MLTTPSYKSFIERTGLMPDPFQLKAFAAIDMDRSILVAAPTGSGKTLVAQYAVDRSLSLGLRVFYTTPLKALSNQKFYEFITLYGPDRVGLLTGDNVVNPDAEVVVMTTEVLRNMLYEGNADLGRLAYVVMDEVHYLQNPYRGAVWEEVIIHLPESVSLVCLSATVSNSEEFGDWIRTVRGPTDVVVETKRPVELVHLYGVAEDRFNGLNIMEAIVDGRPNPDCSRYDDPRSQGLIVRKRPLRRSGVPRRLEVVEFLKDESMVPAVFFIFSRQGCEAAVEQLVRASVRLTTPAERSEIRAIVDRSITNLSSEDLEALGFSTFMAGLESGIAAHHAGMVPPLKEAVEECFSRALVKVVFATETLSLGINMPARTVVIEKLNKFNGETHELLTPGEYTQLSGRAGRRGIDEIGYCLSLWSPFVSFDQVSHLMLTSSYPLTSSFRPTYNMAANLVKSFEPEIAHNLLNLSFAQFRSNAEIVRLEARLAKLRSQEDELLEAASCELGDVEAIYDSVKKKDRAPKVGVAPPPERLIHLHLSRLRPGDVIIAPSEGESHFPTRLAIVSSSKKKGGRISAWAISTSGQKYLLRPNTIDFIPKVVGRIEVEVQYDPKDHDYLHLVADHLRDMPIADCLLVEPLLQRRTGQRELEEANEDEMNELRDKLRRCPDFTRHIAAIKRLRRIQLTTGELRQSVKSNTESLARQFDRVLEVLTTHNFVVDWELTTKGERLAGLFHESDLLIALAYDNGVFAGLDSVELASLLSVFVYEPRTSAPGSDRFPSRELEKRFNLVCDIRAELNREESRLRIPPTKSVESGFMVYAGAWARGRDLASVIGDHGVPGGDFVRFMKQIIDLARQLASVVDDPQVALNLSSLNRLLCRGVVEASIRVQR
ncbi:unnamed protein product [Acidithrix sp. C25]|nr:unnamed protein product [Acidithrix sp. C25]